jgi:hypothetical protein
VGYISARIIQLGYIQQGVTVQQEYDTQRERKSDDYDNTKLKAMMGHKQNTFYTEQKGPWEITGMS